jgi:leucyl aminopeptidase
MDVETELARMKATTEAVVLARDLTNTPSLQKSPRWFADRVANAAARRKGVTVTVHDENDLAEAGFGGVLAVGGGSDRPPRLVELSWRPRGAGRTWSSSARASRSTPAASPSSRWTP